MEFLTINVSSVVDLWKRIGLPLLSNQSLNILHFCFNILYSNLWCLFNDWSWWFFALQMFGSSPSWFYDWKFGSTVPENVSILDVFLKKEHFARNIVHCLRYFGSFNRQHIVYLCLLLLKCNGPHGRLTILSMMDILQLIKNYLSD